MHGSACIFWADLTPVSLQFMTVQNTGVPVTATGMGYTAIQQTRPQTLSYGLNE